MSETAIEPFVHLHVHSYFSQLDGMSSITGLVNKAIHCGMKALALTDHGNMFGIKELHDYVKKKNKELPEDRRLKPIFGVEAYCARRTLFDKNTKEDGNGWHLILLAKNKKGYQNLCKLVSTSWIDGFYYHPRIDKAHLERHSEGLIVASACLGGEIPQKIMAGNLTGAEESIRWFKKVFGDDFYLELQRHQTDKEGGDPTTYLRQIEVNRVLLELAQKTQTKLICTNDVHFVEEEHAEAHDRLICLGTGKDLDDTNRLHYTKQEWFKSQEEMYAIFSDLPEALRNTEEIADKVEYYSIDADAMMPVFPIPESFATEEAYRNRYSEATLRKEFNADDDSRFDRLGGYDKIIRIKLEADYLRELTLQKATVRYGDPIPNEVMERLDFELETMKMMGFPGYFLIVQDFIQAARDMHVAVGPGRGSAAGSVVAYCLRITDIDPMKYDLLFERFLNPDRISMPDIDIDFDDDGRDDVLRWVTEKYGKERVAHIVTYGTMAAKMAIKDVARVQRVPLSESDRLSKLVPDRITDKNGDPVKANLSYCIEHVKELHDARYSDDKNIAATLKYAEMLEGTVRQTGIHACGVIIGADDLTNYIPLAVQKDKNTGEDVRVTQYEGSVIETVGLIKMDFLGLKTLSIIKEALSNIKKSRGIDVDIDHIPIDNKETYDLYSTGQTIGTFQFESAGMQKYLRDLQPSKFEDLIAMNALYRPGPMAYIPDFIDRKHGKSPIIYDFPEMESRLKDTYGITVYQEQVMLLSRDLAGFTRGQSDELRKAMGKKLKDKMEALHEKFIQGATKNGFGPVEKLEKIWSDWVEFAKYAFNKSHATCYSWISYQTAYLKAHYPAEFMAANLTRNRANISEVTKCMDECRRMGIKVLGPDINESESNFTVNKVGDIRFGLGGIKGVGTTAVEAIMQEREKDGPFKGIFDFAERVSLLACNRKTMESLSLAGAFDTFSEVQREHLFTDNGKIDAFLTYLMRYGSKYQTDKKSSMNSLFGGSNTVDVAKPEISAVESWSKIERLNKEKELVGIYLSSHPLDEYYIALNYVCTLNMKDFEAAKTSRIQQELLMGGMVIGYREGFTRNNSPFGILKMEDFSGSAEIPLFGRDYIEYGKYGRPNMYLLLKGMYVPHPHNPTTINFRVLSIHPLNEVKDNLVQTMTVTLPLHQLDDQIIADLSSLIRKNPGHTTLYFKIEDKERQLSVSMASDQGKYVIDRSIVQYLEEHQLEFAINK
ncbi:MAG: DNA polymerase III subunit alpha [Dysgonamonadaceae bacterium]|jgi:DNA polymerase-3 subunit alpha|nr:DNA polymerase III subunit alpha [Dysgonamonadaceae bacterium]